MRAPAAAAPGVARPLPAGSRRRSRAVGWVAAAVVCVLAIAAAVHVLQDASSGATPDSANRPAPSRTATATASPSASASSPAASPSPTVTLPASVSGTWSGPVQQGSGNISTEVKLTGNSTAGMITYSGTSFTCSGNLTLESSAGHLLTMNQEIVAGDCGNGVVKLTQEPDGTLRFHFKGASSLAATGTLTRQ
jgi:hypothetical protein